MTKITIPTGTNSVIRIAPKPEQPTEFIERIGVSVRVASEMLGVGVRTMWTLAQQKKVRTVRIGTRVIFSVESLREFIDGTLSVAAHKPDGGELNPSTAASSHADNNGKEIAWVAERKEE